MWFILMYLNSYLQAVQTKDNHCLSHGVLHISHIIDALNLTIFAYLQPAYKV